MPVHQEPAAAIEGVDRPRALEVGRSVADVRPRVADVEGCTVGTDGYAIWAAKTVGSYAHIGRERVIGIDLVGENGCGAVNDVVVVAVGWLYQWAENAVSTQVESTK